jgi:ethanolamine-phosphate cytidylyltransferase
MLRLQKIRALQSCQKKKGSSVVANGILIVDRYRAVEACKWVDEVVRDAPYVTSLAMLNQYNIDYCVHGDDLVTSADGKDTYWEVKAAGKFK